MKAATGGAAILGFEAKLWISEGKPCVYGFCEIAGPYSETKGMHT